MTSRGPQVGGVRARRSTLAAPLSEATTAVLLQLFGVLVMAAGTGGLIAWIDGRDEAANPGLLLGDASVAFVAGALMLVLGRVAPSPVHRRFEPLLYVVLTAATIAVTLGQVGVGPGSVAVTLLYVEVPVFAVYLLRAAFAALLVGLVIVQFGLVLLLQPGYSFPASQYVFFCMTIIAISAIVGGLLHHSIRAAGQLAGLRRFLPAPVADALLSSANESLLEPHRRKIGVLFCDLRGFTRFAGSSEPEEVVEVLGEYFGVVDGVLSDHNASVGMFAGDGILAYVGDPVRIDDPAQSIVRVAGALREPLDRMVDDWTRRGFRLSYGIGVSFGYATLGVIGSASRSDYTALGSVVNLAARLSDEASGGEILVDDRCYQEAAIDLDLSGAECSLELKGFEGPIVAHRLVAGAADSNIVSFRPASAGRNP